MQRKKILALVFSVSLLVTAVAACGTSGEEGTGGQTGNGGQETDDGDSDPGDGTDDEGTDSPSPGETSTITITFRDDGQGSSGNGWQWYENAHASWDMRDSVELDIAPITAGEGDYFTRIALALQSAETAPDLVQEDTFQLPSDARANYLTDMTDMVEAWEDWTSEDGIIESLKLGVTVDGRVYGVPYNTDTRGLWYNKVLFEEAGFDAESWAPATWEELIEDLKTIKEAHPDVVPLWLNSGIATGEATTMQTYQMLLYGTGDGGAETLFNDDKWVVESQGILDSLNFIRTIYQEELGPPLSRILDASGSNTGAREFLPQGKAAVELDGSWITGNYKPGGAAEWAEYADVLGFAPMPDQDGNGTVTLAGGWALSIPERSDNKEVTFEFIKHLMSTEVYTDFIIKAGSIATRYDTAADPAYTEEPFMQQATEFLSGAGFRPINDDYPAVSTAIQSMVESVVTDRATPEQAMEQFKTDVTRIVGDENVVSE